MANSDERLHCFSITKLERALKHYYKLGKMEPTHVLTPEEMSSYMSWMMKQHEKNPLLEISFNDIPSLLNSAEVVSISKELTGQKASFDTRNAFNNLIR